MFDSTINFIRKSDAFVFATVRSAAPIQVEGTDFIRLTAEVHEAFKGLAGRSTATIDLYVAGLDTPRAEPGGSYLFFLGPADDRHGGRRQLVDLTVPVPVPEERRAEFLGYLRQATRLAEGAPDENALKQHVFRLLDSRLEFFVSDALRIAREVRSWSDGDIDRLVRIAGGADGKPAPAGNDHQELVILIVQRGSVPRVTGFARGLLRAGDSDGVYYGLLLRKDPSADEILWKLLRDGDTAVRDEALRVAGLLRRLDVLNAFQAQYGPGADERTKAAIARGRSLAARD